MTFLVRTGKDDQATAVGVPVRPDTSDHYLISPTAKLTAYARARSDIPYSKEISDLVGAEATTKAMMGGDFDTVNYFMSTMTESRYKGLDRELARTGYKNVLEIAAGLLPRGLIMTADPQVKYVATDLPDMLRESEAVIREIMKKEGLQRPNLTFRPANVLDIRQLGEAIKPFNGEPFAVVCEGLITYLRRDERTAAAKNIHTLISNNRGLWITTDIVDKASRVKQASAFSPEFVEMLKTIRERIARQTGRLMSENYFVDQKEAENFFGEIGFDFERSPYYDGSYFFSSLLKIPDLKLRENLRLSFADRQVWVLRPRF